MVLRLTSRLGTVLILVAFPLIFASCGSDSGRYPLEGAVSLDGEPVDQGAIVLMPVAGDTIKSGGEIVDGRYQISPEKGPALGKHKVLLYWDKKTGATRIDSDSGDVYDERLEAMPEVFHSLETPIEIDITTDEKVHDFHVTTPK